MTTAAHHLATIGILWPHLDDALDQHSTNWLTSKADLFRTLDQADREEAAALRALERDPQQIGETPAPISLRILDTARLVETTLVHLADTIAPQITRPAIGHAPQDWRERGWTRADHDQRNAQADQEQADPKRWRYVGLRTAEYAAGWLHARVTGEDGPFRPLNAVQLLHVEQVAAGCAQRIADALDLTTRTIPAARPCPTCRGQVTVIAGGGRDPEARCTGVCGRAWTMADTVAA
ncbi:hypothetical protein [Streptomyces sp. NBC_01565]|uniref:hypothetical protein n=1 Tax=Streptomyces sp. NBC_01565 TaxID=2975881 RepID=UPI00225C1AB3|nr:hypothetical protein [Streptomyces sp. NBC_01565]MCX4540476.1 hypothetical protein [Streptomyces sp. NBC_01565]